MKNVLFVALLFCQPASAQRLKKADKEIIENLRSEITFLANDKLEGRRTGTAGEKLAYEYLSTQFKNLLLSPKGDNDTYIQTFEINEGKEVLPSTSLSINGTALSLNDEYFPFIFSANGSVKANASPALLEKGSPWFFDIKEIVEKNKDNPHFGLVNAIKEKARSFAKKGATAVIVYNSAGKSDDLRFEGREQVETIGIPVLFCTSITSKIYLDDATDNINLSCTVHIADKKRQGHNVIGYLDNGAAQTIIIGAHYDHLGYGEDHNSLWTGEKQIHNGADDNASGTASIIELARMLKKSKLRHNNYLFICFSGEELGLYGSKYFIDNPTVNISSVNYMMNADMIGRLNNSTHSLTIGGFGSSPAWSKVVKGKTKYLNITFDSSGIGPSDHTSFYLKNIPVLFFFTGTHEDYHKPTDDVEKLNLTGELLVIKYIYNIIEETDGLNKIAFSKTREPKMASAHFTVSLGIMPDYTFSGKGVRADGIIDCKIAQRAGIKAGDVIIKLGEYSFSDIYSYMDVLSKFKKGDSTKVTVLRDNDEKTFDIVF
ncbi:MAG: M20/M25/M40 family metallo-hydrolase [Ginsengibacter sp.]